MGTKQYAITRENFTFANFHRRYTNAILIEKKSRYPFFNLLDSKLKIKTDHFIREASKVVGTIKLALDAGKASPAPPVGPALGSKGVNIMAFCKEYNAKTADKIGTVIPVEITVFEDKTFDLKLKTPPASVLIKNAARLDKGSANPKKQQVGSITMAQVEEIAAIKLVDLNCSTMDSAIRTILGTSANMGVKVED